MEWGRGSLIGEFAVEYFFYPFSIYCWIERYRNEIRFNVRLLQGLYSLKRSNKSADLAGNYNDKKEYIVNPIAQTLNPHGRR